MQQPDAKQRTSTASLAGTVYLRVHFTLPGPTELTHAAAASTLASALRSLTGEAVPPSSWSLVGIDPAASVAVYRVAASHESAARAALTSLTTLAGCDTPVPATARVLSSAPFLLGIAADPGGLDAATLLRD